MYFSSVFFLQKERGLAADKVKRNLFGGWLPEPNDPWRKETCIITLRWHLSNSLERNYATTSTSDKEDKYSMLEQQKKNKLAIVLVVAANEQTRLQQKQRP